MRLRYGSPLWVFYIKLNKHVLETCTKEDGAQWEHLSVAIHCVLMLVGECVSVPECIQYRLGLFNVLLNFVSSMCLFCLQSY